MNLIEALNNENSDELQKRIRLLVMSAKDCPTRKGDRVEYLGAYLLSAELNDQIALISLLRQQTESRLTVEVEDFLDDLETRTTSIRDGGSARIIECTSESLARLVVESGETGKYCFYAGGKRVVVIEKSWRNFLNGLRKLGYVLSADSTVV